MTSASPSPLSPRSPTSVPSRSSPTRSRSTAGPRWSPPPRYASPEHLLGVDKIEPVSDIYCLGLILHFLLTGRHASNAQTVREAAERVMLPVPIVNLVDQPESLIAVFQKSTTRDPDERIPSCRELALALRQVLDEVGGVSRARRHRGRPGDRGRRGTRAKMRDGGGSKSKKDDEADADEKPTELHTASAACT